jgi:CheY-like chemotaxis protein
MNKNVKSKITDLRKNAEELLKNRSIKTVPVHSEGETMKLMHELEVHQIELEMQNEELMLAKELLEVSARKYTELYDFAPTGYFTLSKEGTIIELNLSGANMLGKERQFIKNKMFDLFVSGYTKPIFNIFLSNVFNRQSKQSCELTLSIKENLLTDVILTGLITENGEHCFMNMVDITDRKSAEIKLKIKSDELLIADKKLVYRNEEKEKSVAELIIARKELEQFAYIAGHDLQEPLRAVTDFLQVFEKEYSKQLDENATKYFHSVKNAIKRMSILINSLSGFTLSGHKTNLTRVHIKELMNDVIADIDMNKKLNSIMLIDDDTDDNFFHEREIKKANPATIVMTMNSGMDALEYLKSCKENNMHIPDLIFLDINMPCMNGWEFLQEYSQLVKELQSEVLIIMLTTSGDPDTIVRANKISIVSDYITKPLTKEILENIIKKHF